MNLMLLFVKVLGVLCTVAVPAGVCGTQVFLGKKQQENHKKEIEYEFKTTNAALSTAHANYQEQIKRISAEKNTLATTKEELTYKPVPIQDNITALNKSKSDYETHHTKLQNEITTSITAHNASLVSKQKEIEALWTAEKTRVEKINTTLETSINTAKSANTGLKANIEKLKNDIEKTINDAFYTASAIP